MTAQPLPRSQQREGWDTTMHLRQLDNDVDGLEAGINAGLERLADEMAKNRATMWKVLSLIIAVLGVVVSVVAIVLNAAG